MNRDKIKKDYLNKIGQITKLNEKYYNDNNSPASDSYYDTLKKEVFKNSNFFLEKTLEKKLYFKRIKAKK